MAHDLPSHDDSRGVTSIERDGQIFECRYVYANNWITVMHDGRIKSAVVAEAPPGESLITLTAKLLLGELIPQQTLSGAHEGG